MQINLASTPVLLILSLWLLVCVAKAPAHASLVVPEGMIIGSALYSPLLYRTAWDNNRKTHPIGADSIKQINASLGGDWVEGSYTSTHDFLTFEIYAGLTPRTTLHLMAPYFHSEVRQSVNVHAPPPLAQDIKEGLALMGFHSEKLTGSGWGDAQFRLYHQYKQTSRWTLTASAGWRTHLLASDFSHNTQKLNPATRSTESALLEHHTQYRWLADIDLNYRLALQFPLRGRRDIFRPGEGVVSVRHTPGRYVTHELSAKTHWLERRLNTTGSIWYREQAAAKIDGVREAHGKDHLWYKFSAGYSGMTDYENGVLPFPFVIELRYWHVKQARNVQAYADSYWEILLVLPLWKG